MSSLKPLTDSVVVQRIQAKAAPFLDKPWNLNVAWLAKKGWVAVPAEKGRHFEEPEAARTARAMQALGCRECYAIATEPMGEYPACYSLPCTQEGLLDFSDECATLNFALLPESEQFVILCTSEDYNLFAGPKAFVEAALGTDVDAALKKFREFASDEWWKGKMLEMAKRYEF